MKRYYFQVFADYFYFDLLDDNYRPRANAWNNNALKTRILVKKRGISIATFRNMFVPVIVEISETNTAEAALTTHWDHIAECSFEIKSGKLVIIGNDYYPDAPRIPLERGIYQARIYFGGGHTVSGNGLDGNDVYLIELWRKGMK